MLIILLTYWNKTVFVEDFDKSGVLPYTTAESRFIGATRPKTGKRTVLQSLLVMA
jgi:hypothetical protein